MRPSEGRPVADRGGLGSGLGLRVRSLGSRGHSQDTILPGLQPGPLRQVAPNSVPPPHPRHPFAGKGSFPAPTARLPSFQQGYL